MNTNRMSDTVKLDINVSRDYHRFILGNGGYLMEAIMKETDCYVNLSHPIGSPENYVTECISICGTLKGVEEARRIIRISCPNVLRFDLPRMSKEDLGQLKSYTDLIQNIYNVQADIIEENVPEVVVIGNRGDNSAIDAINLLLRYVFKATSCVTVSRTNMRINSHLHSKVLGLDEINIESIEVNSRVQIKVINDIFTIEGRASDVVVAQEQLTGCMPITLTFKVSNSTKYCKAEINSEVSIEVPNIFSDGSQSVMIEGLERHIDTVYKTYSEISQKDDTLAEIASYHFKMLSVDELADIREERSRRLDTSTSSQSDTDSCDGDDHYYADDSDNLNEDDVDSTFIDTSDLDPDALPQNEWMKNLFQCVNDSEGQTFPRESRLRLYSSMGSSNSSQNSPEASNTDSNASSNNDGHIDYHNNMISNDHSIDTDVLSMEGPNINNDDFKSISLEPLGVD